MGGLNSSGGLVKPTHFWVPPYYKTFGPEVADLNAAAGFDPDPEQRLALDAIFARQSNGLSAAFEVGVVCGRQNIKTALEIQAINGWLYIFDTRLVVYSAHEFGTAMEVFRLMVDLVTNSDLLRREVKKVVRNHGEEAIELNSGARVIFRTRTKGGGRGLSGNRVVLDEGMFLKKPHMGALLPTMSAQPDPQVFYGSSAGMAESEVLREVRDRGRAGGEPRLAYLEWCAPDPEIVCDAGDRCTHAKNAIGCGADKPDYWVMANPALGKRRANGTGLSFEYIKAERRALPVSEFCRERLGWWDQAEEGAAPLSVQLWRQLGKSTPGLAPVVAVGVDVSPDSAVSAIGVATWRDDGVPHVELVEHLPGTGWVLDQLVSLAERRNPVAVVLNPAGPAGAFEQHLRNRGFVTLADDKPVPYGKRRLVLTTSRAYAQACGDFTNMVTNQGLGHASQAPLDTAVEGARSRPIAQAWGWDALPGVDICPLVAVTLALHGLVTFGEKKTVEPFFLTGGSDDSDTSGRDESGQDQEADDSGE
jgi:hypothetical protein